MRGEVPEGWQETRFENIASVGRGLTYSNKQECLPDSDDAVCVLRIPNVQEQRFDPTSLKYINGVTPKQVEKYSVPRQAILMVGSNGNAARVGNCCFVDSAEPYLFASFLMRVVPDQRQADSKFFYYLIAGGSVQDAITESVEGSTGLKNISLTMLRQQRLLLPPLPEQRKIAAILSSLDEAIAATEAVIAQTRRVKEGLLQDLLTRGIGRGGRPHTRFKQTEIGEIPESWEVRKLLELCSRVGVGIASSATHAYRSEGIPLVRNQNIKRGYLDLTDLLYVTPEYD
ncbi:MAG: restriction endonuclease subunit S, partial [Myxococcota bacterium]